jgi:cell division protease FtsH
VQYYLNKIQCDETVSLDAIVADTNGATPARIMSAITKDAVRIALFSGRGKVSQRDIDLAFQEQYFGIEHPIEEMEDDQRRVLAYHEAGHAIAQHYLMPDERIARITIIRRGGAFGYVMPVETKEWHIVPLRRLILDIMVSMAGRAAEIVFFGERFNSVGGDYANIRYQIWRLYNAGMFGPPLGQGTVSAPMPDGTRQTQGEKDRIIEHYWRELESRVEKLLDDHAAEVHAVVKALLQHDLTNDEFLAILQAARAKAIAEGKVVPEGLPVMTIQLLPEHQQILALLGGNGALALPGNGADERMSEEDEVSSMVETIPPNGSAPETQSESAPEPES